MFNNIKTLKNYTFYYFEQISILWEDKDYFISFETEIGRYKQFSTRKSGKILYDNIVVFEKNQWVDEIYKTIYFLNGQDEENKEFIYLLSIFGKLEAPEISEIDEIEKFDLSNIVTDTGIHKIEVVSRKSGYVSSDEKTSIIYRKY